MEVEIKEVTVKFGAKRRGEPFRNRNKIYIFIDKETILENLLSRYDRPYKVYKELAIPKLMEYLKTEKPKVFAAVEKDTWSWRQSCGCSMCPCSPGFIGSEIGCIDFYVTIK